MSRTVAAVAVGVLLSVWCLRAPAPVRAAGELQGRELAPARDLQTGIESGLESLLGGLLGGGQKPPVGRIESVVVTQDAPGRLTVSVSCSGELEGRRVRGELMGRDRRVQREIRAAPARLQGTAREVELSFVPAEGAPEALPESAFLRVSVDGGGPGLKRVYTLGKSWNASGSAGGSGVGAAVVSVKARPEARAKALPSAEPTPAPPVVRPADVRDHRGEARPGVGWTGRVRDHRGGAGGVVVTDHRRQPAPGATPAPAPPPSAGQRRVVLTQTAAVVRSLPRRGTVLTMDPNLAVLSPADQQKGARGPNVADVHDLLADVVPDVPLDASQVLSIRPTVFRDQDPASGYFYFLPRTYHLAWLADKDRYDMAMLYLAATTAGSAGEVSMAAGLTAGIDADEMRVAKDLLKAYCRTHACPASPELRPFPIDPARVAVSLSGTLRLFNIPAEKVAPVGLSSALGDFQLAWVTDPVTKENVQLVLEESGINGNVTFAPPGAEGSGQLVDVEIKLADAGSFARPRWRRNEAWRNPTPYPVRVKYLHALVAGGAAPSIYSWNLGGAMVAPGGRVECDAREVPEWIDRKASRLWIEYAVNEDCTSCTHQVVKAITGGVTSVAASQITFHTMNVLAEMGAYELTLRVRSTHFDPDGKAMKEKAIVLRKDNEDFTLGPIYAPEPDPDGGDADVLFEYLMGVAMTDGTVHVAKQWAPSRELRALIGRKQIQEALGFVPGGAPSPEPSPTPTPTPDSQD